MIDIRVDIERMLNADAVALNSCRKYIKVTLFEGEFGKATPHEEEIKVRNYTQAAANLKRIAVFFRDMDHVDVHGKPRYPQAEKVRHCMVGAIVITIGEKLGDGSIKDVVVYDIPLKDGLLEGYTRKVCTTMGPIV